MLGICGSAMLEAPTTRNYLAGSSYRVFEPEPEPDFSGGEGGGGKKPPPSGGGGRGGGGDRNWGEEFYQFWENHNPFSKYVM